MSSHLSIVDSGLQPSRRPERRAATAERLAEAAVEELRAVGYDGLTVRNVARRAAVAPATAYTYYASKDHLVAEAFGRALDTLPPPNLAGRQTTADRVVAAIADVARLVTEEPALAAGATAALFADEPDVAHLRRRVGAALHDRFRAALGDGGDDVDEGVLLALDLAFSGALVRAGVGELAYGDVADVMATVARALT
jgi:AcrR family transcriptional regulator